MISLAHKKSTGGKAMKKSIVAAVVAVLATITSASAENYPSRPITFIVPFSAGGPTDALARILGERMRQTLGQPILVENVTGAGGAGRVHIEHRPSRNACGQRRDLSSEF
jgi:tripartite-type tricarboxylate transporter receptor subunit TctC